MIGFWRPSIRSALLSSGYDADLRVNPGKPCSLFGRGMAKHMKGNLSDGDTDISAAEAIKPYIADEIARLGP
jgi:hypothetical protein